MTKVHTGNNSFIFTSRLDYAYKCIPAAKILATSMLPSALSRHILPRCMEYRCGLAMRFLSVCPSVKL